MPFIGRDWRSPGEAWVKTEALGWQRMKIIEAQLIPACHNQTTACSWPPRQEFGQHMAQACNNSGRISPSNCNSAGNSPDSARRVSTNSPSSPTGSPEKQNSHHLYTPITISSPYGQYSCCTHHIDSNVANAANFCDRNSLTQKSLSRENIAEDKQQTHRMRLNRSVSDFRVSINQKDNHIKNVNKQAGRESVTSDKLSGQNDSPSPILMRNGDRIETYEIPGSDSDYDAETNIGAQENSKFTCCCTNLQASNNFKEQSAKPAPHCRISVRTREVAMYNTISEAFYRLDFCNAIHDIRRFNYICKLLHLLITQNLTSLSGCATKVLFTMLEQVAWEVSSNKRNIHVLKNLLNELKHMIQKYYCWGRPIGSSLLWQQHFDTIERISQIVDGIELSPPAGDSNRITFTDLPVEMVGEILLRLNDYRDLVNSAQASSVMRSMINGQQIWQQLCRYHFNEQQLKMAIENYKDMLNKESSPSRGVKYARTSSADGRTSFRNRVSYRDKSKQNHSKRSPDGDKLNDSSDSHSSSAVDRPSSSYVTRTIQIFDQGNSSTSTPKERKMDSSETSSRSFRQANPLSDSTNKSRDSPTSQKSSDNQTTAATTRSSSISNHEIDWERVFHQLRK